MSALDDLSPCPWCKGTEMDFVVFMADGWIACDACEAQGPHSNLAQVDMDKCKSNAAFQWNDRGE